MATRIEKVRLGVFLTASVILVAVAVALLSGSEVWAQRWEYVIRFRQSVSGLESGAPVKLRGVRVGYVDRIRVDPQNVEVVQVWISVDPGTPVKKDTKAYVSMQGITGLKYIELKGGSKKGHRLKPGGKIPPGTSTLQELTGRATEISLKVEKVLNNLLQITREQNRQKLDDIITKAEEGVTGINETVNDVHKLAKNTDEAISQNRDDLEKAIKTVSQAGDRLELTLDRADRLIGDLQQTVRETNIPEAVDEVRKTNQLVQDKIQTAETGKAVENAVVAIQALKNLMSRVAEMVAQNQDNVRVMLRNFRAVSEDLKDTSRTFQEKPWIHMFEKDPEERELPK